MNPRAKVETGIPFDAAGTCNALSVSGGALSVSNGEGLGKQQGTEAHAVPVGAHGEPGQQDDADRVRGKASNQLGRRIGPPHRPDRETEEAGDRIRVDEYERACRVHVL